MGSFHSGHTRSVCVISWRLSFPFSHWTRGAKNVIKRENDSDPADSISSSAWVRLYEGIRFFFVATKQKLLYHRNKPDPFIPLPTSTAASHRQSTSWLPFVCRPTEEWLVVCHHTPWWCTRAVHFEFSGLCESPTTLRVVRAGFAKRQQTIWRDQVCI